jgi:hypothetical protein
MDYKPDEQVLSTTFSGAKKLIFSIKGLFRCKKFGKMDTVAFSLLFGN